MPSRKPKGKELDLSAFPVREQVKRIAEAGPNDIVRAGWIPPDERTPEQRAAHEAILGEMPPFAITGSFKADVEKVVLWDATKAVNNGQHWPGIRQVTGSCVGASGGVTIYYLSAVEVVRLRDPEQALVPFWPLTYGRSRFHGGMRGRGEGSFGSAWAKAASVDGIVPADAPGLPKYTATDGYSWGRAVEMEWSDGARISSDWLEKSRKHLVRTTAECKSSDNVRDAMQNHYPCIMACSFGGRMQCPEKGDPPVLLNDWVTTWQHQQSIIGWWDHPTLGQIFRINNQWGRKAHGTDPDGAPPGGYWILASVLDRICKSRHAEVIACSQFDGFPANPLDLSAF